ncbi:MAG: NADH-quinone oxidoreductase subunit H [Spirochaetales bacterium]|nr:NADH-quinone oxidoreductase subunit H [Spirochaetales bacterium]
MIFSLIHVGVALVASPLLVSLINRTKAFFGGRKGPPLLQPYYDLIKLLRKGAVYSTTTSWIFKAGPVLGLTAIIGALFLTPLGNFGALISFHGDFILLIYILGFLRFFYVLAALDTGSSFEGMGASREMHFSLFCELALLLSLASIAKSTESISLTEMMSSLRISGLISGEMPPLKIILFAGAALFIVFLTENARIPVDDPNTHLELTMIHEVMVLDHCGVDLGFIHYTSYLKLWVTGALFVSTIQQFRTTMEVLNFIILIVSMGIVAILVGIIESIMARLRLVKVSQLTIAASVFALLALIIPGR